jgi:quinol monooxygenase YgiN
MRVENILSQVVIQALPRHGLVLQPRLVSLLEAAGEAPGCRSWRLRQVAEQPGRWLLQVEWSSLHACLAHYRSHSQRAFGALLHSGLVSSMAFDLQAP